MRHADTTPAIDVLRAPRLAMGTIWGCGSNGRENDEYAGQRGIRGWPTSAVSDGADLVIRRFCRRRYRDPVYSVRLNPDEVTALQAYAENAGLPASTLVRSWIIERLRGHGAPLDLRTLIHDEGQAAVRDALQQTA